MVLQIMKNITYYGCHLHLPLEGIVGFLQQIYYRFGQNFKVAYKLFRNYLNLFSQKIGL